MAVFADQLDLRTAVVELVKEPKIVEVWPRILGMAERRINRSSRHRKQIDSVTLTFVNGAANLPADFLEILHLYDQHGSEMFQVPLSTTKRTGSAYRYFAIDGSQIIVYGLTGSRDLDYYAEIPSIAALPTDTSWLLNDYPDVYLYTAGAEAAAWLQDVERAGSFAQLADQAMREMAVDSHRARFSRGVIIPRGVNP